MYMPVIFVTISTSAHMFLLFKNITGIMKAKSFELSQKKSVRSLSILYLPSVFAKGDRKLKNM